MDKQFAFFLFISLGVLFLSSLSIERTVKKLDWRIETLERKLRDKENDLNALKAELGDLKVQLGLTRDPYKHYDDDYR